MREKKTLVIGASLKPDRYSYKAINMLVSNNIETKAYGLREGEIAGIEIDTELLPYSHIDTVSLYVNKNRQPDLYNYIISLKPKRVIFNPGTENTEFQELLLKENIAFEEACTLVLLSTKQY
ncbi:CoA-binding protein [Pseudofulvibacter geojedonensis]|uniref:CoA-binding protein n=1 Tax=Pseudofulvibacter geojedonensis TaxID=1123758 RepID=A0ABW3HZZ0_9FLAO